MPDSVKSNRKGSGHKKRRQKYRKQRMRSEKPTAAGVSGIHKKLWCPPQKSPQGGSSRGILASAPAPAPAVPPSQLSWQPAPPPQQPAWQQARQLQAVPSQLQQQAKRLRAGGPAAAAPVSLPPFVPPEWHLLYDGTALEFALQALLREPMVGLDIEWRPTYVKGQPQNPVALLQLSSATTCVLVHLRHLIKLPPALCALLSSPSVWKVGCGVGDDAKKLLADCGLVCESVLEIGEVAVRLHEGGSLRFPHLPKGDTIKPGLKGLAAACGYDLSKPKAVTRSNWERYANCGLFHLGAWCRFDGTI